MELAAARLLSRELMERHGLREWSFRFDRARRRAGSCDSRQRRITLSSVLVPLYDEETVRGVILHEIAHAAVGPAHHHDDVWKAAALLLGAPPTATLLGDLPTADEPWVGKCPVCGRERRLYRAPRRVTSCGACSREFRPDLILDWTRDGLPAVPGGAYAQELAAIHRRAARRSA